MPIIRSFRNDITGPQPKRWKRRSSGTSASTRSRRRWSDRPDAPPSRISTDLSELPHNLKPRDQKDVEDAVQWALGGGKAIEIVGHGSKRAIGRPVQTDVTLDLSGLTGVTLYEPEELVLSAKAGTPLAEIEALTAAKGQMLAFEPMDYGPIFLRSEEHTSE